MAQSDSSSGTKRNVIVLAGPSGSGKNAIIHKIHEQFPNVIRLVTATTRAPRPGEEDGVDYLFFSQERFDQEMAAGNIPEHRFVPVLNTYYGIYLPELDRAIASGKIVFAQVDIEGMKLLKECYNAATVFIMPESIDQFEGRIRVRNPEWSETELKTRMKITHDELMNHAPLYDYRVVNADGALPETVAQIIDILKKEGYALS